MVSVVFAIWPSLNAKTRHAGPGRQRQPPAVSPSIGHLCSKRRASFRGVRARLGFDIAWQYRARAEVNDVNDVPSLSEPHGPHGAVADGRFSRAEIFQS